MRVTTSCFPEFPFIYNIKTLSIVHINANYDKSAYTLFENIESLKVFNIIFKLRYNLYLQFKTVSLNCVKIHLRKKTNLNPIKSLNILSI